MMNCEKEGRLVGQSVGGLGLGFYVVDVWLFA